ncbi:molybdenum cofactor biosynthesis protein A [Aciduliprofundum sp. MAR08-339]|nr:molybdenum cofactor biosynthesis protein A [Aciduliprofundum sp. MAR08-339]
MKDRFGRPVKSIRVSLTERCNLNCFYCHREGEWHRHRNEMAPEEVERILKIARALDIRKVKFTGGEPLMREDIVDIVARAAPLMDRDVSLTTNGTLLSKYAQDLKDAGLMRVNISLDTLDPEKYRKITRNGDLKDAMDGVHAAIDAGLNPVKLNMVLLRGINEDEIERMIEFSAETGAILQIIELETPVERENTQFFKKYHVNPKFIEEHLEKVADEINYNELHRRKRFRFKFGSRMAEVEIVRPMHNSTFCMYCTRIRLTSDGKLKPCLLRNDNLVDILGPLRNGASDDELLEIFKEAILRREPYFK